MPRTEMSKSGTMQILGRQRRRPSSWLQRLITWLRTLTNRRGAPDTRVTLEGVGELGEQRTPFDRSSDGDLDLAVPNEDAAHLLERSASIGQQLQPAPARHACEGSVVIRQIDPSTPPGLGLSGRSPDGKPRAYLRWANLEGELEAVVGR